MVREITLDGDGDGSGYGYGYGYGYGSGYGDDDPMAQIDGYNASINRTFGVLQIGCEVHTLAHWRENWRSIADKNGVKITEEEVREFLKTLEGE